MLLPFILVVIESLLLISCLGSIHKRSAGLEDKAASLGLDTSIIAFHPHKHAKKPSTVNNTSHQQQQNNVVIIYNTTTIIAGNITNATVSQVLPSNATTTNTNTIAITTATTTNATIIANTYIDSNSSTLPVHHEEQLFYMYELDKEFWWRWPVSGSDCSENGYVGHEHAELSGYGPLLIPDDGLFLTWHFSLFSSLYNRMKRSRRRTLDPDKASLFIIPYDLGLDGYLNADVCTNSRSCTRGLPGKLNTILKNSKYFTRYDGGDHAVLWSLGQYHPWPHNGCDVFMKDTCGRCTFTCYWMDSTKTDNRFISVPFPSGFHWWDGIKNLPWSLDNVKNRTMTSVYLGGTQTLNPAHTKIRRAMTQQCNASIDCNWIQIAHSSKDPQIGDFLSIYKKSVFCLCPPGDDPARKAVFDSIISGCIPVIFEKKTIYDQYPWHIGEEAALDISVYIPGGMVRSGKIDFISVLKQIPADIIRKKQQAIEHIAPRVQYAVPPIELLKDINDTTPWDPPFPDGVDITLDGLFERVGHIIRNESTGIPKENQLKKSWNQEYEVVIIKVPGIPHKGMSLESSNDLYKINIMNSYNRTLGGVGGVNNHHQNTRRNGHHHHGHRMHHSLTGGIGTNAGGNTPGHHLKVAHTIDATNLVTTNVGAPNEV